MRPTPSPPSATENPAPYYRAQLLFDINGFAADFRTALAYEADRGAGITLKPGELPESVNMYGKRYPTPEIQQLITQATTFRTEVLLYLDPNAKSTQYQQMTDAIVALSRISSGDDSAITTQQALRTVGAAVPTELPNIPTSSPAESIVYSRGFSGTTINEKGEMKSIRVEKPDVLRQEYIENAAFKAAAEYLRFGNEQPDLVAVRKNAEQEFDSLAKKGPQGLVSAEESSAYRLRNARTDIERAYDEAKRSAYSANPKGDTDIVRHLVGNESLWYKDGHTTRANPISPEALVALRPEFESIGDRVKFAAAATEHASATGKPRPTEAELHTRMSSMSLEQINNETTALNTGSRTLRETAARRPNSYYPGYGETIEQAALTAQEIARKTGGHVNLYFSEREILVTPSSKVSDILAAQKTAPYNNGPGKNIYTPAVGDNVAHAAQQASMISSLSPVETTLRFSGHDVTIPKNTSPEAIVEKVYTARGMQVPAHEINASRATPKNLRSAAGVGAIGGGVGVGLGVLNAVDAAKDIANGNVTPETIARTGAGVADTAVGVTALTGQIAAAKGLTPNLLAHTAARVAIPVAVVSGAAVAAAQLHEGKTCEAVGTVASTAGGLAGAWAGAKLGAAAGGAGGALVGGIGALPGAAGGAVIGGLVGALGAGTIASNAATAGCDSLSKTSAQITVTAPREPLKPLDENSIMFGSVTPAVAAKVVKATAELKTPVTPTDKDTPALSIIAANKPPVKSAHTP